MSWFEILQPTLGYECDEADLCDVIMSREERVISSLTVEPLRVEEWGGDEGFGGRRRGAAMHEEYAMQDGRL